MSAVATNPALPSDARHSSGCPFAGFSLAVGRWPVLLFGVVSYLGFLGTYLYSIGFVGNWLVPKSIDGPLPLPPAEPPMMGPALLTNTLLLSAFVLQHTIMARPTFKRWWTCFVPTSIERSIYVLAASLCLAALFAFWKPIPGIVWQVTEPIASIILSAISLAGHGLVLYSSFLINHFDLFGLRQVWIRWQRRPYTPVEFILRGPYKFIRHPLMLGFLIAFWVTPTMSAGHLFFAIMTTGYIFMGTWFEERDLIVEHGESYLAYRRTTPAFLPISRLPDEDAD